MAKASEEDLGAKWAVVPLLMKWLQTEILLHGYYIDVQNVTNRYMIDCMSRLVNSHLQVNSRQCVNRISVCNSLYMC